MPDTEGLAIMNCALALPSKYDAFRQTVCIAYACESNHQVAFFKTCLAMATTIKQEEGFNKLPPSERHLFNIIHVAIDRFLFNAKASSENDWQSDRWKY